MKIRWREHEIMLVSLVGALILAGYLWHAYNLSTQKIAENYAAAFINNHAPFHLFRNLLLPDIALGLAIYLSYLWISFFTIPRLLSSKKAEKGTFEMSFSWNKIIMRGMASLMMKKLFWTAVQIILVSFILLAAFCFQAYYSGEYLYNYPGFSIFQKNGFNSNPQINTQGGFKEIWIGIALFGLYILIRETAAAYLGRPGNRKSYRIRITNQITLFIVVYLILPFFIGAFGVGNLFAFFRIYAVIPPVFLVILGNLYWLFPLKGDQSIIKTQVLLRLLFSTFLFTLPFIFIIGESFSLFLPILLMCWAIQLFVVTPLSWLLYQQHKDQILEWRGIEAALVKSNAGLQFLRSQINPHFLFNVLNTLYGTALQENAGRTAIGIQQLGDMMRFMLHDNNLNFIPMNKEIEYLKNYISLQKLRTQSSPEIVIEAKINDQDCNHMISPMILIPFVENAFKHGISLKKKSWVIMALYCDEANIRFEVRNSIHLRQDHDPENEKSGIGLSNVVERLKLLYPGQHELIIRGENGEFHVQLKIRVR